MQNENSKLVYSTEQAVPRKNSRAAKQTNENTEGKESFSSKVTVRLDRKGRGGKSVTIIEGVRLPQKKREALLRQLKAGLGTGGTVKDTSLEIQGDHCNSLMEELKKMGYRPKRSGG